MTEPLPSRATSVVPRTAFPTALDWTMGALSAVLVGGFFVDLWAHTHGQVDNTFLTPWHGVLYGGAFLFGFVLFVIAVQAIRAGEHWRTSLQPAYRLSFVGAVGFATFGVLDLIWHTLFGIEQSVSALLSPTHLGLATSGFLMAGGVVRSAWSDPERRRGIVPALPWVIGLTMCLSALTAFTQYVNPVVDQFAEAVPDDRRTTADLYLASPDGSDQSRITRSVDSSYYTPALSPDGTRIAYMKYVFAPDGSASPAQLYVANTDGSVEIGLFAGAEQNGARPAWSPDGRTLAYNSEIGGATNIWLIPAAGGEGTQLTHDGDSFAADWSPDGSQIAYTTLRDGRYRIAVIPATGGQETLLTGTDANNYVPSWSPDGGLIAFLSEPDIWVMAADGGGARQLTNDDAYDTEPAWSPDGSRIAFASDRGPSGDVWSMATHGGDLVNLTTSIGLDEGWGGISWRATPDGERILYEGFPNGPALDDPFVRESLGLAAFLLSTTLLMGVVLLAMRHGPLPFGSLTLLLGINAALMAVMHDSYRLVPAAVAAGLASDVLYLILRPSAAREVTLRAFAAVVPFMSVALYLLGLALTAENGLGWTLHMVLGAPLIVGIVGLLLSYLAFPSGDRRATVDDRSSIGP